MADYHPLLFIVILLWITTATDSHSIHDSNSQVANVSHKRFTRTIKSYYELKALKQRYGKMTKHGLISQVKMYESQLSTLQNTYCALTAKLEYCTAKYNACYTEYKAQKVLLYKKQDDLADCTSKLTTCQATLSALETSLATATATLATCQANYATCDANYKLLDMTYQQCLADKATCDAALIACEAALNTACDNALNGAIPTKVGSSYYLYFRDPDPASPVGWNAAQATCADKGMNLAQISDEDENSDVAGYLSSAGATDFVYIGANDLMQEKNYVWVPGTTPVTYTPWASASAANALDINCSVMRSDGTWWRSYCWNSYSLLCEVKAQCVPYM